MPTSTVEKSYIYQNVLHDYIGAAYRVEGTPTLIRIYHDTATQQELDAILADYDSLTVLASKAVFSADGVDFTSITVPGLGSFHFDIYAVLLDEDNVPSQRDLLSSGTAETGVLELSTNDPARYLIVIDHYKGFIQVVSE